MGILINVSGPDRVRRTTRARRVGDRAEERQHVGGGEGGEKEGKTRWRGRAPVSGRGRRGAEVDREQNALIEHSDEYGTAFSMNDFEILQRSKMDLDLDIRLLESLYVYKRKPKVNAKNSVLPLRIVA